MASFGRDAAGSGIPQLKVAFWKDLGYVRVRSVWIKFVAGSLSIGGGSSLGREGPTVYIAGGVASWVAGLFGIPKHKRRHAVAVGAAAVLAAAFNTPLAAIMFVLEELVGDMNSRLLGSVVLSSLAGAFVVFAAIGKHPAFGIQMVDTWSWNMYLIVPLVAAAAALLGIAFQNGAVALRGRVRGQTRIPPWMRPLVGGWITWVIGAAVFLAFGKIGVFGLGYTDLSSALNNSLEWKVAGILVCAKLLATIACYGWEGCGGIFAPTLFIGGLVGCFFGGMSEQWLHLAPSDRIILSAVGMSACFGATVRAPLTAILIVFEMTHQFSMVPALMLGILISQGVARLFGKLNFYDSILRQDGHDLFKIIPPRDFEGWRNMPVSPVANSRPAFVTDMSEQALNELLARPPYHFFPVLEEGKLQGGVTRREIESALKQKRRPGLEPIPSCGHDEPLHSVEKKFIESPAGIIVVHDPDGQGISGILTLHDLLRAQAALQE